LGPSKELRQLTCPYYVDCVVGLVLRVCRLADEVRGSPTSDIYLEGRLEWGRWYISGSDIYLLSVVPRGDQDDVSVCCSCQHRVPAVNSKQLTSIIG
jgi:hypothetical protein